VVPPFGTVSCILSNANSNLQNQSDTTLIESEARKFMVVKPLIHKVSRNLIYETAGKPLQKNPRTSGAGVRDPATLRNLSIARPAGNTVAGWWPSPSP
jgi:hypothetical protein